VSWGFTEKYLSVARQKSVTVEFNEPFRFVDVMFDIAYTVMDLEARRQTYNAYLNTYVEQTGDWEGLQVLPLYLSRQHMYGQGEFLFVG